MGGVTGATAYNSADNIDQIVFASGTFTLGSGSHGTTYFTNIGMSAYPVGIFSTDGGSTWNDFGGYPFTGNVPLQNYYGVIQCDPTGKVTITIDYPAGAPNVSVVVKFVLISLPNQTIPLVNPVFGDSPTGYTSVSGVYRRIITDNHVSGLAGGVLQTIPHGVGAVPMLAYWGAGYVTADIEPWSLLVTGNTAGYNVCFDATNIYVQSGSGAWTDVYYRIYDETE